MKVMHLDCGTMCPVGIRWLGLGATIPCHCLLVETSQGLVLVDTGYGLDDLAHAPQRLGRMMCLIARPRRDPQGTALKQIEALGYSSKDVRHLVVTHLDNDHAGGLPDFPEAQVHVYRPEQEAALELRSWLDRTRYSPAHWRHQPQWRCHDTTGERWHGFEAVRAIAESLPEILLVPLTGHSRGHCGVAVQTKDGWLLHAGDAIFSRKELEPAGRTPLPLRILQRLFQANGKQRRHNAQRLQDLALSQSDVRIICSHDPIQFRQCVRDT